MKHFAPERVSADALKLVNGKESELLMHGRGRNTSATANSLEGDAGCSVPRDVYKKEMITKQHEQGNVDRTFLSATGNPYISLIFHRPSHR